MIRIEKDSLGEVSVPKEALYGAQTSRALENFVITKRCIHPSMIRALAIVKRASAKANYDVGAMSEEKKNLIVRVCDEIETGMWNDQFPTDAIQGGAGTSVNMNINEVIANRASQLVGDDLGSYQCLHPNNDVNMGQSTNDVIPTAARIAILDCSNELFSKIDMLIEAFEEKRDETKHIMKVGRTHLQDAVPISFGEVFGSFASLLRREKKRLVMALEEMKEVNIGATAVGTGINAHDGYREKAVSYLGEGFVSAVDLVDATKHVDSFVYIHSHLCTMAMSLSRMCNDLRLMASGPYAGFSELVLQPRQPGSSIMPGKINPVIFEVCNQVAFEVIGNDTTVILAGEAGQMELNVFEPVMLYNLFNSFELLTNAFDSLTEKGIRPLRVNEEFTQHIFDHSLVNVTSYVHELGYDCATEIAKLAMAWKIPLNEARDIVLREKENNEKISR